MLTPAFKKSKQEQWWRVAGDYVALKEEEVFLNKKTSVRRDTDVVSGLRVTIVRSRHRKPNHFFWATIFKNTR